MSLIVNWLKTAGISVVVVLARAEVAAGRPVPLAASPPISCASPEYREFDFWVGDWDVFESDGAAKVAHVRVDRILDGCVLRERYEDVAGLQGESFSIYDAGKKLWHQTWATNRGQLLTLEGQMERGEMVLAGASRKFDGRESRVRGTWKPVVDGVRETAVTSSDAGSTWKPWFDLSFRRRQISDNTADEDAKVVAALDEQFQAAVKANDEVTMNKILADDFVLVAGSGKVFNKADLLTEARTRSSVYEHQEDTERTVRVWGDTAVVTAKLWIKATREGKPINYTLWFSDTYVRTPAGWRYVFGQASLPVS